MGFKGILDSLSINGDEYELADSLTREKVKRMESFIDSFESVDWQSISGSLPNVKRGRYFIVNNSSHTTMTGINGLPDNCVITLLFADSNTTLDHTKFKLKGGISFTPSQYSSITLVKNIALTSSLIEINRTEM